MIKFEKNPIDTSVYDNKVVIIWGAGASGELLSNFLHSAGVEVSFFCDLDSNKQELSINGIEVISPEKLNNLKNVQYNGNADSFFVHVALSDINEKLYFSTIKQQLSEFNILNVSPFSELWGKVRVFINYTYAYENFNLNPQQVKAKLTQFRDDLKDERSKRILDARVAKDYEFDTCLKSSLDDLIAEAPPKCQEFYKNTDFENHKNALLNAKLKPETELIFYGIDESSQKKYESLFEDKELNSKIFRNRKVFFVDDNCDKTYFCGCEVRTMKSMDEYFLKDSFFVLLKDNSREFLQVLYMSVREVLTTRVSTSINYEDVDTQYFEENIINLGENEIFVDVGVLNGYTSVKFAELAQNEFKHIYLFEPNLSAEQLAESVLQVRNIQNYTIFPVGLWNKKDTLRFIGAAGSFRVTNDVGESFLDLPVDVLDHVLKDVEVTFIKMDVEGSELNALKGAKDIISLNKPKLAISLYHKPEDLLEIYSFIKDLVPEYKFYLRHYSSHWTETVLYAVL